MRRLDHGVAVLTTVFICLVLWLPGDSIPPLEDDLPWRLPPHADKWVHGLLFFVETLSLHRSARWWPRRRAPGARSKRAHTAYGLGNAVMVAILLAVITEWFQGQIPQRNIDGLDLVANLTGILAFVLLHVLWRRFERPCGDLRRPSLDATELPRSSNQDSS